MAMAIECSELSRGGNMGNIQNLKPWPKGVSGNPAGYSRGRRQIDDLMELINEKKSERDISQAWLDKILEGNFPFLNAYLERRDGKLPVPVIEPEPATMPEDNATATPITTKDIADAAEILKGLGFKFHEKP